MTFHWFTNLSVSSVVTFFLSFFFCCYSAFVLFLCLFVFIPFVRILILSLLLLAIRQVNVFLLPRPLQPNCHAFCSVLQHTLLLIKGHISSPVYGCVRAPSARNFYLSHSLCLSIVSNNNLQFVKFAIFMTSKLNFSSMAEIAFWPPLMVRVSVCLTQECSTLCSCNLGISDFASVILTETTI